MHQTNCVLLSILLMIADGSIVRGPSGPLVAPLGSSVVLPCYVDKLLLMKGLEVEWRRTDSGTLVHLYEDGESRAESQQEDYHDRAHFFKDQIQHGNFSLRLDNLRAEDEGQYTCRVYSQQDSGEAVVQIKINNFGEYLSQVLSFTMILEKLITEFICPVIFTLFVHSERLLVSGSSRSISASVGEDVTLNCSVDSHITPEHIEEVSWKKTGEDEDFLVLLYQNKETQSNSSDERYRDRVEFFTAQIPKGNFSLRLKSVRAEDKGVYMCQVFAGGLSANANVILEKLGFSVLHIMVLIVCIAASGSALLLCCLIYSRPLDKEVYIHSEFLIFMVVYFSVFTENEEMPCHGEICKWIWDKIPDIAAFSIFILPSLQFTLLFIAFRTTGGGIFVSIIFPLFFFLTLSCLNDINREKSCKWCRVDLYSCICASAVDDRNVHSRD
ncbi:Myelin-oligodendrocyte glycoprotein [Labeo rohita]|uniref:Myelin-oligodendrocyte glycoprotein n=1 Tax=Labeo rohita TaxID=84645 RepID=A0ABQ8L2T0_LABRO|nr:Myelin-oligodendrocyte glycoprotein [Labeo rohita]